MLIVISNAATIANEAAIINALFDEGLEVFHLRKPETTADELRFLLDKIKPSYHPCIALHQHHFIANDYSLKRLHFRVAKRKELPEETLIQIKQTGNILSTSIHQTEEYRQHLNYFAYTFFGPIFNSISKQRYASTISNDFVFPVEENHTKVIALGGITATNLHQVFKMKFNGIAVLGAIWQNPNESIQQFKAIQKAWKQTNQL